MAEQRADVSACTARLGEIHVGLPSEVSRQRHACAMLVCEEGWYLHLIIPKIEMQTVKNGDLSSLTETLKFIPSMRQTQQAASMWPWRRPPDDPTTTSPLERI